MKELIHRTRRLHPSGFATMTQHLVSLVALHFPHFYINAAESNAPYSIQGCKYYITLLQSAHFSEIYAANRAAAAAGVHSITSLPLCPQAARILYQDRLGSHQVI